MREPGSSTGLGNALRQRGAALHASQARTADSYSTSTVVISSLSRPPDLIRFGCGPAIPSAFVGDVMDAHLSDAPNRGTYHGDQ